MNSWIPDSQSQMPQSWIAALPPKFPAGEVKASIKTVFPTIKPAMIKFYSTPTEGLVILLPGTPTPPWGGIVLQVRFESETAYAWLTIQRKDTGAMSHHLRQHIIDLNDLTGWLTLARDWKPIIPTHSGVVSSTSKGGTPI